MKSNPLGPRNPVAKNGPKFNKSVRFRDRKLRQKQGYEKHKTNQKEL